MYLFIIIKFMFTDDFIVYLPYVHYISVSNDEGGYEPTEKVHSVIVIKIRYEIFPG